MSAPVPVMRLDVVSEFPYKHSTGEVIGRFLAGLKEQKRIWGQRVAGLIAEEIGTMNGTFLNGARVRAARLRDGDEIRVGAATAFRFSTSEDARGAAVLPA